MGRRGGSPRRLPESPRRRVDSPVRRRVESPYRRAETPPRRRPASPARGRSPSSPPRRLRSPARFGSYSRLIAYLIIELVLKEFDPFNIHRTSPRRMRGSPIRRCSPPRRR